MDKTQVRTAADLEKKYNFAQLLGFGKNLENTNKQLIKVQNELNNMLNSLVINLGDLLDSQSSISLWFYDETPTLLNEPYINWNDPTEHYGDFCYDRSTGDVYKFTEDGWEQQDDVNLINAMALTNVELDVEQDHERQVFFDTPEPPYQSGDWWILEDGTLMICQIGKLSGDYEENDFINSSRYADAVATKIDNQLTVIQGTVAIMSASFDEISSTVRQTTTALQSLSENVGEQITDLGTDLSSLQTTVETNWSQTATQSQITAINTLIGQTEDGLQQQISNIISYVRYGQEQVTNPISGATSTVGVVTIGMQDNPIRLKLANDILYFEVGGNGIPTEKVAYIGTDSQGKSKLYIVNAQLLSSLQIGNFAFIPRDNGSLSFRKVG